MSTKIFVNLPVKNLAVSKSFFSALGFSFNAMFADENMEAMIVSDDISVLLLVEPYFKTFTTKPIADAVSTTEVILSLGVDSREQVDELVDKAMNAGAQPANDPKDLGYVYGRSFQDPDGHIWEVTYINAGAA